VIRRLIIGAAAATAILIGGFLAEARPAQAQMGADVRPEYGAFNPATLGVPSAAQMMDVRVSPAGAGGDAVQVGTIPAAYRRPAGAP
jgi:hypothetical protein